MGRKPYEVESKWLERTWADDRDGHRPCPLSGPRRAEPDNSDLGAGRRIAVGKHESFDARGLVLGKRFHLVIRTAQEAKTRVRVRVGGKDAGTIDLARIDGWEEVSHLITDDLVTGPDLRIELANEGPGDFLDYHAWITQ